MGAARSGASRGRAVAGRARRAGAAVARRDRAGCVGAQPAGQEQRLAVQRAAGGRSLAQRRAAGAGRRARPGPAAAGGAAAQHALRRPVLRSRDQAAVPDGPARDARGDRRASRPRWSPIACRTAPIWPAALREAAALLRREQTTFAPHTMLVVLTDGALPADADARRWIARSGTLPGLELSVAAFIVRAVDDDAAPAPAAPGAAGVRGCARRRRARRARRRASKRRSPARWATSDAAATSRGVRVHAGGRERLLAEALAPGAAASGVIVVAERAPRAIQIEASAHGRRVKVRAARTHRRGGVAAPVAGIGAAAPRRGDAKPARDPNKPRLLVTPGVLALVEPVVHPARRPRRWSRDRWTGS